MILETYSGLILFYEGFKPNNIGHASNKHLAICMSDNRQEILQSNDTICLTEQNKSLALEKMGFSTLEANKIYKDTYGYLDLISIHPKLKPIDNNALHQLEQLLNKDKRIYCFLFLSGAWDSGCDGDRKFLEALSRKPYADLRIYIDNISNIIFLEMINSCHKILLKKPVIDCFLETSCISNEDFWRNVKEVFSEKDKISKEEQPIISNSCFSYSSVLRKELADTLIILAIQSWQDRVDAIVDEVTSKIVFFSLRDVLHLFAEASPGIVIARFKLLLSNDSERKLLERFFKKDKYMFVDNSHVLFNALKIIVWNELYFSEVVEILVEMAKIKFCTQGCLATLHHLFIGWFNITSTPHNKRIDILEKLYPDHSEIIWNVLCRIFPSGFAISSVLFIPKYRDWCDQIDFNSRDLPEGYFEYIERTSKLVLQYTDSLEKCIDCVSTLFLGVDNKCYLGFIDKLEEFLLNATKQKRFEIKQKIAKQIENARKFDWKIPDECLRKMQKLVENIHFNNPVYEKLDFFREYYWDKKEAEEAYAMCLQIIRDMYHAEKNREIFILIGKSNSLVCSEIGKILYEIDCLKFKPIMLKWLVSDKENKKICANNFFLHNIDKFLQNEKELEALTAQQRVELFKIGGLNDVKLRILQEQKTDEQKTILGAFSCQ